jgi:hypothetical protein
VVAEILRMHRAGECLAQSKVPMALLKVAHYHLGSLRGAIEVAGLDYDEVREPFSGEELLLARQRLSMTAGELAHVAWREALVKALRLGRRGAREGRDRGLAGAAA